MTFHAKQHSGQATEYRGNDGDAGGRALLTELIRGSRPQPNGLVGLVT